MIKLNKTEQKYFDKFFELKPDCSGKELWKFLTWMSGHVMIEVDRCYGRSMDDIILNIIMKE